MMMNQRTEQQVLVLRDDADEHKQQRSLEEASGLREDLQTGGGELSDGKPLDVLLRTTDGPNSILYSRSLSPFPARVT